MAPTRTTLYHTMTSPNTNAFVSLLSDVVRAESKPMATGFRTIYLGKDKNALSILEIAPIDGNLWKKNTSFMSLSSTMRAQMDVYPTSDIMSLISQEIPIDAATMYMGSTKVKDILISRMTDVENLFGLAFLHSGGSKAKNIESCDMKHRIADLAYIRLGCCLNGEVLDSRIQ